ncbi:uncharacterized protein fusl isoform X2 [Halyomorpha halys]|uniref:uncharacterized protein fusl isoform X2 n=1 Tax=Halyomorpha halys TaxID=286706 RepID=UPI0006D4E5D7|nr:uncharacterized protein LOC106678885 isoform X2 [Halyomorpha halys]
MFIITILDILISSFIVTPLLITFWWGTWSYQVYSNSFPVSWSLYISTVLIFLLTLLREPLYEKRMSGVLGLLIARIYIYLFAILCITQWNALFTILDLTMNIQMTLITVAISITLMSYLRSLGTLLGPPYFLFLDHKRKTVFIYPTMFQKGSTENLWVYLLDCVFSVCVIGMLVVFVWRGCWTILDTYLYPENIVLSTWMSLGIGYTIVGITFALQPPMKYLATELSGIPRMLIVDIYLLFSFCGTVNVWRGIWKIQDLYFFPEKPELSYALSHFVPFLLLVLINSSNSILVRGVYIDGEEAGAQCVDFPCYYLRLIFQSKRKDKILREAEKKSGEKDEQRLSEGEVLIQVGVDPVDPNWKNKSINNFCSPEVNQH